MRVAFGVSVLSRAMRSGGADGIGHVCREMLQRLRGMPSVDLLPFEYERHASGYISDALPVGQFNLQAAWSLVTGQAFQRMQKMLSGKVDLVHATDHYIPRLRGVPVLATIMDAIPLAHPEWVDYRLKYLMNEAWRRSAHWADHVLTISEFSRKEIAYWFGFVEKKISVIPLGVDARWFTLPDYQKVDQVRKQYALPERFFLAVGTLQPRKNLELLVKAHNLLPAKARQECPLLIVGRAGWGCEALVKRLESRVQPDVRWLSYVPDENLHVMVASATALVFPSLYEGFGLPVLEAFAAGTPVIASSATSLPEVCGDAALLVDPKNCQGWTDAMYGVFTDESLAQGLRVRGRARAKCFPWERTAAELVQLYERLVGY